MFLASRAACEQRLGRMTDRPLILIADDDPVVRSFLQRALERNGFDTVLAANGREALDRIGNHSVEVVLLDVAMPVLGGLEALREIRSSDRTRTLPVILITGSGAEADEVRGLESGADDYLAKPITIMELVARVRAQVRNRAAWTRELERAREGRRKLAAALEGVRTDLPLLTLATHLANRLPAALEVDGVAILHFGRDGVRSIASGGALRRRFPPTQAVAHRIGLEIASRSASGAWLEAAATRPYRKAKSIDVAYVPFRLGPSPEPLGCLAFGVAPTAPSGPLSHRLPDLIDATDFIVAVLRPAVEQAETADTAINRIRLIVARREFVIHLQPIVRLDSGATVAVEALTRFASGLPPDSQFAEAASLGLGPTLERAAVAAALEAAAAIPATVALSLNLSADVLQHEPTLPELLASTERPLIVELTEHERIDDYEAVRSALDRLGPKVKLAIDDAGSGYASLRHIFALQPSYVKLDIEWVRGIDHDPVRRALVSGLVYFATETGCELIAEGIETAEELKVIRELGIRLGQGYLLGRPGPNPN
jgi:EAL domain-containing protein (putative c-di-GMP-specific phosphodiesterase class I)/DNA-binding NarL/FixJ family response regulator